MENRPEVFTPRREERKEGHGVAWMGRPGAGQGVA